MEQQKKRKIWKWIIGIVLVIIIITLISDSSIPRRVIDFMNADIEKENQQLQIKIDSIKKVRVSDSLFYENILRDLEEENRLIQNKINTANYKLRQYEEAFKNYNTGDFYSNYLLFTKFLTGSDTIPNSR